MYRIPINIDRFVWIAPFEQATQRLLSTFIPFRSIQPALHTSSHLLQPLQFSGFMRICTNALREKRLSSAPTGQTVLQYKRPRLAARSPISSVPADVWFDHNFAPFGHKRPHASQGTNGLVEHQLRISSSHSDKIIDGEASPEAARTFLQSPNTSVDPAKIPPMVMLFMKSRRSITSSLYECLRLIIQDTLSLAAISSMTALAWSRLGPITMIIFCSVRSIKTNSYLRSIIEPLFSY